MSEYKCSNCGGDATVGMSGFKNIYTGEYVIQKDERLCFPCVKKLGVFKVKK